MSPVDLSETELPRREFLESSDLRLPHRVEALFDESLGGDAVVDIPTPFVREEAIALRYDATSMTLHWVSALIVLSMFATGWMRSLASSAAGSDHPPVDRRAAVDAHPGTAGLEACARHAAPASELDTAVAAPGGQVERVAAIRFAPGPTGIGARLQPGHRQVVCTHGLPGAGTHGTRSVVDEPVRVRARSVRYCDGCVGRGTCSCCDPPSLHQARQRVADDVASWSESRSLSVCLAGLHNCAGVRTRPSR